MNQNKYNKPHRFHDLSLVRTTLLRVVIVVGLSPFEGGTVAIATNGNQSDGVLHVA